jgi:hypothetical protein
MKKGDSQVVCLRQRTETGAENKQKQNGKKKNGRKKKTKNMSAKKKKKLMMVAKEIQKAR